MFFANMAEILLQNLSLSLNKEGIDSVKKNYKDLHITTKFQLKPTTEDITLKLSKSIEISKAARIDNFPKKFLKDVACHFSKTSKQNMLPFHKIWNFS